MAVSMACRPDGMSHLAVGGGPRSGRVLETASPTGVRKSVPIFNERGSPNAPATLPATSDAVTSDRTGRPHDSVNELGTLGGANSVAYDVNNLAIVVGSADTRSADAAHAVLWQGGVVQDLGVPPGDMRSQALAIDDVQQIIGCSYTENGPSRGLLLQEGAMQDLGSLGGSTCGRGLNQAGQVVEESEVREDHRLYVALVPIGSCGKRTS